MTVTVGFYFDDIAYKVLLWALLLNGVCWLFALMGRRKVDLAASQLGASIGGILAVLLLAGAIQ